MTGAQQQIDGGLKTSRNNGHTANTVWPFVLVVELKAKRKAHALAVFGTDKRAEPFAYPFVPARS